MVVIYKTYICIDTKARFFTQFYMLPMDFSCIYGTIYIGIKQSISKEGMQ